MKTHFYRQRPNAYGGFDAGSLCGRLSAQSADGMNVAEHWGVVTCKFCLKLKPTPTEPRDE